MKTLTVGTEFFHIYGRTDRRNEVKRVAFRNFSKAPKNECPFHAVKN